MDDKKMKNGVHDAFKKQNEKSSNENKSTKQSSSKDMERENEQGKKKTAECGCKYF